MPHAGKPVHHGSAGTLCLAGIVLLSAVVLGSATPAWAQVATGSYTGNGLMARPITGVGFQPAVVIVKGNLAESAVVRTSSMPFGWSKQLSQEIGLIANRIQVLESDGFRIGTDPDVNQAGVEYQWIALAELAGSVYCGSYTGDGVAGRQITGLAFEPGLVMLIPGNDARCRFRTAEMPAAASLAFDDVPLESGVLTTLNAAGFTVGANWQANESGAIYHYVAVARLPGRAQFGTYLGNGNTNRVLNNAGFRPRWVFTKSAESKPGGHQTRGLAGSGRTLNFWFEADFAEGIQQFTGLGFALGNHERVNEAGKTYYWAAFASGGENADLAVTLATAPSTLELDDEFTLTATIANGGPDAAGDATLLIDVPADLELLDFAPEAGLVSDLSTPQQIHVVYALEAGQAREVTATYRVLSGSAQRTFTASVASAVQIDPAPANNAASTTVSVRSADLSLALAASEPTPAAGDTVTLTAALTNLGPDAAIDPTVVVSLPPELVVIAAACESGSFDSDTKTWSPAALAAGSQVELLLAVEVTAAAAGQAWTVAAAAAGTRNDPQPDNNTAQVTLTVGDNAIIEVASLPFTVEHRTLLPGGPPADVLRLQVANRGALDATLHMITFRNPVLDGGDQSAHDAHWAGLELRRAGGAAEDAALAVGLFSGGEFTVTDLNLTLAAGDELELILAGTAALTAPDGVALLPTVAAGSDLVFPGEVVLQGTWPLIANGTLTVDGMTAAQIVLYPIGAEVFQMGSVRNLALDVVIPGNGGQPDELTKLNVVNLGQAANGSVLTRLEAWADQGDGVFDPVDDPRISQLYWTGGDRYEASALSVPIPAAGLRVFVTVDVAADALGGTVRLSLPSGDDVAINVASGNDGPIDIPVENPLAQTISATDRIIITTAPLQAVTVAPGTDRVQLIHLMARNLYDEPQSLRRLRVRNVTTGSPGASQADLDGTCTQLFLHQDGNGDGQFDGPPNDPVIATAVWQDGAAVFEGLSWALAPDVVAHLFLTANVSLHAAADGDSLGAAVATAADVQFHGEPALVGAWPLDGGVRQRVRGMVAAQIACPAVPPISLAAGEGPALAFDITIPSNGYLEDTLQSLRLTNQGTAAATDIAALTLWADDGDGGFDPAADSLVATFTSIGQDWLALDLDLPIPVGGRRLFTALSVRETPADSATVRLAIPVNGLVMDSTNDGPRDRQVASATTLLISTAPLLSSLGFELTRSTTDMSVLASMRVANVGGETVVDIAPSELAVTGSGALSLLGGPSPASLALAPGEIGYFTWQFAADSPGTAQIAAHCSGVGAVGGQPRTSLTSTSSSHLILEPAADLGLYPVTNMPFSINRGQIGVVPLILTLLNDGGEERAEIRLDRLVITLDDGDDNPIVPAELLARVTVNEGVHIYCDRQDLETSGQTIALDLVPPVTVTAREPATLSLRMDILANPAVSRFRVSLQTASSLTAVDAVSGLPVGVDLVGLAFPVLSATGSIVAQAVGLEIAGAALPDRTAGAGQFDVELLRLALSAAGEDVGGEVKVGSFAIAIADTNGLPLVDPAAHLSQVRVQGPLAIHSLRLLSGPADSLVIFQLSPQITVPAGAAPVTVSVRGDVAAEPVSGPLRVRLAGSHHVDARDGNISAPVPVSYASGPIVGPVITLQQPALALHIGVEPRLPSVSPYGARDIAAMALNLAHPGSAATAAVRLDTLRLTCLDAERRLQDPRAIIEDGRLLWNGVDVGAMMIFRGSRLLIPLGGSLLPPGGQITLGLRIDLRSSSEVGAFELIADDGSLDAVDANLDSPVALVAAPSYVLPGSSGLTRLQPASAEILAGWTDRLPPFLPDDLAQVEVACLQLSNPAPAGSAPLELTSLRLRTSSRDGTMLAAGEVVTASSLWIDGVAWAAVTVEASGDTCLVLEGSIPLILPAGASRPVVLQVAVRAAATASGVRFGLLDGDIVCRQPGGGNTVTVRSAAGQAFPFWTAAAGAIATDLAGSYLNFPNPFAAGRETTSFAFNLPRAGRVTLQVWTPRGEAVATLVRERSLEPGLHQDILWDGRNGKGHAVVNGVYLAELVVSYTDGGSERLLRKVAVAR